MYGSDEHPLVHQQSRWRDTLGGLAGCWWQEWKTTGGTAAGQHWQWRLSDGMDWWLVTAAEAFHSQQWGKKPLDSDLGSIGPTEDSTLQLLQHGTHSLKLRVPRVQAEAAQQDPLKSLVAGTLAAFSGTVSQSGPSLKPGIQGRLYVKQVSDFFNINQKIYTYISGNVSQSAD